MLLKIVLGVLQRNLSGCSKAVIPYPGEADAWVCHPSVVASHKKGHWQHPVCPAACSPLCVWRPSPHEQCSWNARVSSSTPALRSVHHREDKDLEMFYKIEKGMVNILFPKELIKRHMTTRGHRQRYIQIGVSINAYQHLLWKLPQNGTPFQQLPSKLSH